MFKLEKEITLYKNQFDELFVLLFGGYELDRQSLELDGLLFRIKYMIKHNKDLDKIEELKKEFTDRSLNLRSLMVEFMYQFLTDFITLPEEYYPEDGNIFEDLLVRDVSIDSIYMKFQLIVISDKEGLLKYIDESILDDGVFNMFPNEYFRFNTDSYNDAISKTYPELFEDRTQTEIGVGDDSDVFVHNFTFQTTEACSLNCLYCYQFNKTPMRMDFNTAKQFIDNLLADEYGYINRYNSPAIIIEFIGGEPLLEINLTRNIYEYFLDRCYELDHPWFTLHRVSICSNGLSYFDEEVQDFFKEYSSNISFNISIDGNKQLHDSCRIQPNGEGSYDVDMVALNHYNTYYSKERNSKMTLAPSNIKYLFESVVDFIDRGMRCINLNCVFEEGWNQETAREEYYQLKKLADYIIDNNLENIYIAIFRDQQEWVSPKSQDGSYCGGDGSMLALRPNGQFYPCIRYMPTSVGDNVKDLCLGTVQDGFVGREDGSEVLKLLDSVSRRGSTNDICYECPLSNACAYCLALGHTIYGTPNKRVMFTCIQMYAEHLANVYYWNRLLIKHPNYDIAPRNLVIPDEWALLVINKEELEELNFLESFATIKYIEYRRIEQ